MTTTMTRTTPAPAGLDPATIEYAGNMRTRQRQIWGALSADHVWQYIRVEDTGTPWAIVHRPTGVTGGASSITDATDWTARYGLEWIEREARRVVDAGGRSDVIVSRMVAGRPMGRLEEPAAVVAERLARAVRVLAVLAGDLVAAAPTGVCYCGSLLAGDVHADVCRECPDSGRALPRVCRLLHLHTACGPADPMLCDHVQCRRRALPDAADCARGRDWCCGCCDDDRLS